MGFRIPKPRIPYYTRQICSDSGFHKKKIYRRSSYVAKRSTSSWPPDRAEWNNKTTGLNGKGRFRPRLRGPDKFLKGQNLARIWPYQKYKCRSNFLTGRYGSIFTRTRVNNWTVRVIGQFARWKAGDYNSYAPLIRKSHFNADTGKKKLYGLLYTVHCNRIATVLCKKFVRSKIGPDPTDTCIQKGTDGQTWSRLKRITIWPNSFSKVIFAVCSCNRLGEHVRLSRSCDFVILTEFLFFRLFRVFMVSNNSNKQNLSRRAKSYSPFKHVYTNVFLFENASIFSVLCLRAH